MRRLNRTRSIVAAACVAGSLLGAESARADDLTATTVDTGKAIDVTGSRPVERTWLYGDTATVTAPGQAVAISRLTYTSTGASVTRPFASSLATPGAMLEAGGEVGLLPRLSLAASGLTGEAGNAGFTAVGATAGLRLALLPLSWRYTHAVVSGGYLRELTGNSGAWGRFTLSQDVGRARFAGTLHGEHVFAHGRDGVDVMVVAGANYQVYGPMRLGVEYVGQDLEESLGDAAEGGARHFVGPTASVVAMGDRLSIVGGPSVGLSYGSPRVLGRLGLAYSF